MHFLLADAVEMNGGSRQLLKILNRLGCVISADTHNRFVTYHAEKQRETDVWELLSPDVFTFASVDNSSLMLLCTVDNNTVAITVPLSS